MYFEKKKLKEQRGDQKNSLSHLKEKKIMFFFFFFVSIISMLKRRNKNNNLVDHCCTATYIHKSISLHHTIDKTDNMSLHINKNTFRKKKKKEKHIHTHTNTNNRLIDRENYLKKNTHTEKLVCSNA